MLVLQIEFRLFFFITTIFFVVVKLLSVFLLAAVFFFFLEGVGFLCFNSNGVVDVVVS